MLGVSTKTGEDQILSKGLSFQYKNVLYQLKKPREANRLQNQKIHILETLDGDLAVETQKGEPLEIVPYSEYTGEVQRTLDSKEIGLWVCLQTKFVNRPTILRARPFTSSQQGCKLANNLALEEEKLLPPFGWKEDILT